MGCATLACPCASPPVSFICFIIQYCKLLQFFPHVHQCLRLPTMSQGPSGDHIRMKILLSSANNPAALVMNWTKPEALTLKHWFDLLPEGVVTQRAGSVPASIRPLVKENWGRARNVFHWAHSRAAVAECSSGPVQSRALQGRCRAMPCSAR